MLGNTASHMVVEGVGAGGRLGLKKDPLGFDNCMCRGECQAACRDVVAVHRCACKCIKSESYSPDTATSTAYGREMPLLSSACDAEALAITHDN